uniref:Uncharacterized protein n=1 Tax=Arundo donax TaxID=35708 RepID=A0A0A9F1N7_ARUDO
MKPSSVFYVAKDSSGSILLAILQVPGGQCLDTMSLSISLFLFHLVLRPILNNVLCFMPSFHLFLSSFPLLSNVCHRMRV